MNFNQDGFERLSQVECSDSTFHRMDPALVLTKASGSWVWDAEGQRYLDLCAGFGTHALGHNPPTVRKVLRTFIESETPPILHGMGDVYPSEAKIQLLEALAQILPPRFTKGSLALSGAQAIEIAIKTCILSRKKTGFVSFQHGYHGLDLGVLPLTSREDFRAPFIRSKASIEVVRVPYGCTSQEFHQAVSTLEKSGAGFAGTVVEPILGRGGVVLPPKGWLAELTDWSHRSGGLVVFDEILTGLGRSGRITWAEEVAADLICLGKALGGGFPLSACFGTRETFDAWQPSQGEAIHTGTFFGHPLSCAVGCEVLAAIVREDLASRSRDEGFKVLDQAREIFTEHPLVSGLSGSGMMMAIHFSKPGFGVKAMDIARSKGVIALVSGDKGQCLSFTPPLNIDCQLWIDALKDLRAAI